MDFTGWATMGFKDHWFENDRRPICGKGLLDFAVDPSEPIRGQEDHCQHCERSLRAREARP